MKYDLYNCFIECLIISSNITTYKQHYMLSGATYPC